VERAALLWSAPGDTASLRYCSQRTLTLCGVMTNRFRILVLFGCPCDMDESESNNANE